VTSLVSSFSLYFCGWHEKKGCAPTRPMSPIEKISIPPSSSKEERRCPYCHHPKCWKHGRYSRKGFHHLPGDCQCQIIYIARYLCRNPPCERTFSLLPEDVLPYCRFFQSGLISVADDRDAGKSAYWIAKSRWELPLSVILRVTARIKQLQPWLVQVCHETAKSIEGRFQTLTRRVENTLGWVRFTRYWYHTFYPRRTCHIPNPHNLTINSG